MQAETAAPGFGIPCGKTLCRPPVYGSMMAMSTPPPLPQQMMRPAPKRGGMPAWAIALTALLICFLLMFALAGVFMGIWWNKNPPENGGSFTPRTPAVSVAPLNLPPQVANDEDLKPLLHTWLSKAWQAEGLNNPVPVVIPAATWKPFVRAAIAFDTDAADSPSRPVMEGMAIDLLPVAEKHPVAAAIVGHVLKKHEKRRTLLKYAYEGLSGSPGNETLAYHVACDLAMTPVEQERHADFLRVITALKKSLEADAGYSIHHDYLTAFLLFDGDRKDFFETAHHEFNTAVSGCPQTKPWLRLWVDGMHHIREGWAARGGGYADTVSDRGHQVFTLEMQKAKKALEASLQEKPAHAGPAVSLIHASLSGDDDPLKEMRHWFDVATSIQIDDPDAYDKILWGMRPRWYGSHAMMQSFGDACLATNRFDTHVPWWYMQAHRECALEWDAPDYYFVEFKRFSSFRKLFDGYENEPKRVAWRPYDRSMAAILSFKCTQYDDAQRWLEKLDFKIDQRVLQYWGGLDAELLVGKTAAYVGESGENLRRAEKLEQAFKAAPALEIYQQALNQNSNLSRAGRDYLETRRAAMEVESKLAARESVNLMPDAALHGWTNKGGNWILKEGILQPKRGSVFANMTHAARVGMNYTLEGEIELPDTENATEIWIAFGYPEEQLNRRWTGIRFLKEGKRAWALLSEKFGEPEQRTPVELGEKFKFTLISNSRGLTLKLNDNMVWDQVPHLDNVVKERYSQIGIGSKTSSRESHVRVHRLSLIR